MEAQNFAFSLHHIGSFPLAPERRRSYVPRKIGSKPMHFRSRPLDVFRYTLLGMMLGRLENWVFCFSSPWPIRPSLVSRFHSKIVLKLRENKGNVEIGNFELDPCFSKPRRSLRALERIQDHFRSRSEAIYIGSDTGRVGEACIFIKQTFFWLPCFALVSLLFQSAIVLAASELLITSGQLQSNRRD